METFIKFAKTISLFSIAFFIGFQIIKVNAIEEECMQHYLGNYEPALEKQCREIWDRETEKEF